MTDEQKKAIAEEAKGMREAAGRMEKFATSMFFAILVLFLCGAGVFIFAGNLTKKDRSALVTESGKQMTTEKGDPLNAETESESLSEQRQNMIFTAITRFATLLLIIYAISILFNVFRYLIRAANYYRARAHALLVMSEISDLEAARFAVLAEAISIEKVSFGKEPMMPLIQLAEAVAKKAKE